MASRKRVSQFAFPQPELSEEEKYRMAALAADPEQFRQMAAIMNDFDEKKRSAIRSYISAGSRRQRVSPSAASQSGMLALMAPGDDVGAATPAATPSALAALQQALNEYKRASTASAGSASYLARGASVRTDFPPPPTFSLWGTIPPVGSVRPLDSPWGAPASATDGGGFGGFGSAASSDFSFGSSGRSTSRGFGGDEGGFGGAPGSSSRSAPVPSWGVPVEEEGKEEDDTGIRRLTFVPPTYSLEDELAFNALPRKIPISQFTPAELAVFLRGADFIENRPAHPSIYMARERSPYTGSPDMMMYPTSGSSRR
jgi:hypothetical protein